MRERVLKGLDSIAAITGVVFPPIGAARSTINATGNAAGNALVYWHIQNDKEYDRRSARFRPARQARL